MKAVRWGVWAVRPAALGVGRGVGQDQDLGVVGQAVQGVDGAGRGLQVVAVAGEEGVEQLFPLGQVEVLRRARAIDVLEQGEPIDSHLQAVGGQEVAEPLHEQAQHLVHVDQDQGPFPGKPEILEGWNGDVRGLSHALSGWDNEV
jgi:hypothetical protein